MKWRAGMRVYTMALVPSDKPKSEKEPIAFKFITVIGGVIEKIDLLQAKKVSVPVATIVVRHLPDGLHEMQNEGMRIQVKTSELFEKMDQALMFASGKYEEYRERIKADIAYLEERLDANAGHLAGINEAQVWGLSVR